MVPHSRMEQFEQNYQRLLDLCDALEVIADSLPLTIAVVLGIRIFQNVAAIRRRIFRG